MDIAMEKAVHLAFFFGKVGVRNYIVLAPEDIELLFCKSNLILAMRDWLLGYYFYCERNTKVIG